MGLVIHGNSGGWNPSAHWKGMSCVAELWKAFWNHSVQMGQVSLIVHTEGPYEAFPYCGGKLYALITGYNFGNTKTSNHMVK